MTVTNRPEALAADHLRIVAVLQSAQARIAGALAHPCVEHAAEAQEFCWGSAKSNVRGLCSPRYELGSHSPQTAPPKLAESLAGSPEVWTRPDRRHPNRHPVTPVRAGVAR